MNKALLALALAHATFSAGVHARVFKLADGDAPTRRVICGDVELAEGQQRSWVTVTRTGSFTDPRYGRFEITPKMLAEMVRNFDANVVGLDIFLDINHEPGKGAAAKVLALKVDGGRLRAHVEWTPYGADGVRNKGYRYLSAEFNEDWQDNEAGKAHGCVLLGAGLTIRPVIKRLDPVTLAVAGDPDFSGPVFVHPGLVRQLTESLEITSMNRWKKFLDRLTAKGIKLSEQQLQSLKAAFEAATKTLAEADDDTSVCDQFEAVAKQLAEAQPGATVQLSINAPAGQVDDKMLSDAVAKALADRDTANKKLADDQAAAQKAYDDALAASKLGEDTRKQLGEARSLITATWTPDQAKALAEQQIKAGEAIEAARQLSTMGYMASGAIRTALPGEQSDGKALSEHARKFLSGTSLHAMGDLKLLAEDKLPGFAQRYLAQYDADNARRLAQESKMLAGGPVDTADAKLPASFEREVIREALSDLNILQLIDAAVEPTSSATHTIPYESRDSSAIRNDGIVYEGQPIHYAGVKQDNDFAYIQATKLAMNLTNEVIHFTQNNALINWDAWARNVASNARIMRELIHRRIGNFLQHAADGYGAVQVVAGAVAAAAGGGGNYKFPNFPVVRPFQARDLKGNAIGAAENPLVVKVAGAPIAEYDGSGTQAAGNYYRVSNWNLGYLQIVNQAGVLQAGVINITADFHYATNIVKVDLDIAAGSTYEQQLNKVIQAIGARKAMMSSQRFVTPNAQLMSPVFNDLCTNAEQFTAQGKRNGADTTVIGDLQAVKDIPSFSSNAPGLDMGDDRTLLMERGLLRYRIAKTYAVGAPFEAIDPATGKPIGKKVAYGEEYGSICVPGPLRNRLTSVVAYSFTGRANF